MVLLFRGLINAIGVAMWSNEGENISYSISGAGAEGKLGRYHSMHKVPYNYSTVSMRPLGA